MEKDYKSGSGGKVNYGRGIVRDIVQLAIAEVEGVAPVRGGDERETWKQNSSNYSSRISIDFEPEGLYVDVALSVAYGYSVPEVAYKVQENVKHSVETMTDFRIKDVNVTVVDVAFDNAGPAIEQ